MGAQLLGLIVVLGGAAFVTMLIAWLRGNVRMARLWVAVWAISIVAFGVIFVASVPFFFGGPSDATMEQLVSELDGAYPDEIVAIDYENALPIDPPTLFIDVSPSMSPGAELRFLCDKVKPRVDAVDARIDATTSYGYYSSDDCP